MGRTRAYLSDRARIHRPDFDVDKQIVTRRTQVAALKPYGDWIPARLRLPNGKELRQDAMVKLTYDHVVVLSPYDASGNAVNVTEGDELEIQEVRTSDGCGDDLTEAPVQRYKISGAIRKIRKRTKVVSFEVPVVRETEF